MTPSSLARTLRPRRRAIGRATLAVLVAAVAGPVAAQLNLPGGLGGGLGGVGGGLPGPIGQPLRRLPPSGAGDPIVSGIPLDELRRRTVDALLQHERGVIEAGPAGEPVVRNELLLLSPTVLQLDAARADGFVVLRERASPELDLRHVVLRPPRGMSTADALRRLRAIDPQIDADFNHVYTRSGSVDASASSAAMATSAPSRLASRPSRVGLIDGGIDAGHPALRATVRTTWGCDGRSVPSAHGTAVASLLVGRDGAFAGALPAAVLFHADVYCDRPGGGSAESVVQALAWMAAQRVGVVNVSLVGPANRLLERAVQAAAARGHLIVAAVGNDGPTAPALYPAAYPGVVGVTGVDSRRRVLPEAAQGPQVVLAAPGSEIAVARRDRSDYVAARGTSFAAPLVAGLLAAALPQPDPAAAPRVLADLVAQAVDLGAPDRDPVFGHGLVGEAVRVDPRRLQWLLGHGR